MFRFREFSGWFFICVGSALMLVSALAAPENALATAVSSATQPPNAIPCCELRISDPSYCPLSGVLCPGGCSTAAGCATCTCQAWSLFGCGLTTVDCCCQK